MSVTCAICMIAYEDEEVREVISIKCGHLFHRTCLLEWKNSSKQMTCPECRAKYTARATAKLFLNILPRDREAPQSDSAVYGQLQTQKMQVISLQHDKETLEREKQLMEFELLKSRGEFQRLENKNKSLEIDHAIKCQAYSLISVVNDEYLITNEHLRDQNKQLQQQIGSMNKELAEAKILQLRTSKPYVDLTHDDVDDSDVEIIEEKLPVVALPAPIAAEAPEEVIELEDEIKMEESTTHRADKALIVSPAASEDKNYLKLPNVDDSLHENELQRFEDFLLGEM